MLSEVIRLLEGLTLQKWKSTRGIGTRYDRFRIVNGDRTAGLVDLSINNAGELFLQDIEVDPEYNGHSLVGVFKALKAEYPNAKSFDAMRITGRHRGPINKKVGEGGQWIDDKKWYAALRNKKGKVIQQRHTASRLRLQPTKALCLNSVMMTSKFGERFRDRWPIFTTSEIDHLWPGMIDHKGQFKRNCVFCESVGVLTMMLHEVRPWVSMKTASSATT